MHAAIAACRQNCFANGGCQMAETVKATRKRKPGRPPKAASGATAANDLPTQDDLVAMYRDMLLIRRFEEKAGQLYGMGQIGGFCHLYIGQEAVVVGLQSVSKPGDTVVTSYRDHGHMPPAAWMPMV